MQNQMQAIVESVNEYLGELERSLPSLAKPLEISPVYGDNPSSGDWLSSIEIIQEVALRVAELQESSWRSADDARQLVDDARLAAGASLRREEQALALAADLKWRLAEAAELVETLRAQLSEAQRRAAAAEQMLATSHYYLARLYQSLPAAPDGPRNARLAPSRE